MKPIVVAGHLCLDVFPGFAPDRGDFLARLAPGKLIDVGPLRFATGGTVSNTGLACVRFGADVRLMALLGDDLLGRETRRLLAAGGGDTRHLLLRANASTSYTIVLTPPGVDRIFFHHPGANDLFDHTCVDWPQLADAGLFHFGYPPLMAGMFADGGDSLVRLFTQARRSGAITSLDMALPDPDSPAGQAPWETILTRLLPDVDIFLPSIEESLYMLDRARFVKCRAESTGRNLVGAVTPADVSAVAARALALGAAAVAIKCGYRGIYLQTAGPTRLAPLARRLGLDADAWSNREIWQPCFRVDTIAGATGAGDCAIAGFLCACARSATAGQALRFAVAAGSYNVTQPDSLSGLVSWDEMTAAIDRGWPLDPLDLDAPGWTFHPDKGWWTGPADRAPGRG